MATKKDTLYGSSFVMKTGMTVTVSKLLEASKVIAHGSRNANHIVVSPDVADEIMEFTGDDGVRSSIKKLGEDPSIVLMTVFGKDPSVKEMRVEFPGLMDKEELATKIVEAYLDPEMRGKHLGTKSGIL